jgi:AcrR family transcriptional regulator
VTKQAILYWFPNKMALADAVVLPAIIGEAEAIAAALAGVRDPREAIGKFVRALANFHFVDLDRFRLMYLVAQVGPEPRGSRSHRSMLDRIHPVTSRMYEALADVLAAEMPADQARRQAFAVHSSVLGILLMHGLADALDDPLRYGREAALAALVDRLGGC